MSKCERVAVREMLWPGESEWRKVCAIHLEQAEMVAQTMGFVLHTRNLQSPGLDCSQETSSFKVRIPPNEESSEGCHIESLTVDAVEQPRFTSLQDVDYNSSPINYRLLLAALLKVLGREVLVLEPSDLIDVDGEIQVSQDFEGRVTIVAVERKDAP